MAGNSRAETKVSRTPRKGRPAVTGDAALRERTGDSARDTAGQWSRIVWLDREIRSGRYPNVAELQKEFGIARRTAFLTLDFLRYSLKAPVEYHRTEKGYYYSDRTYLLPAVFLREGELLAVLLAEEVTRQYLGTPLEAPLRAAVDKINRHLPEPVRVQLEQRTESFRFSGGSGVEVAPEIISQVQRAIQERRVLRIRYYTASRDETTDREVEPHFLTNIRGDWMVVCWDRDKEQDRVFMLARIRECSPTDVRFDKRPELEPDSYSQHTFLTEHKWDPYGVAIRFDSYQARWIRERTWHPSQSVEELADGGLILRLQVAGEGDLLRWLLSHGPHAEVLEPAWLRQRIVETAQAMVQRYEAAAPSS